MSQNEKFNELVIQEFFTQEDYATLHEKCGLLVANTVFSLRHALSSDIALPNLTPDDLITMIASYQGTESRRRLLSHLFKQGAFNAEAPITRAMLPGSAPTVKSVIAGIAESNGRKPDDLMTESRKPEITTLRFQSQWVARIGFGIPLSTIGDVFERNHTSVLNGINKINILIARSPILINKMTGLADQADMQAIERHAETIRGRIVKPQDVKEE